ncbi:MAG: pyroglutamyl-peptidase I [Clostridia bacterium]|nr:pyroglutamyl-peptidase I [Clostridia bacterium]
MSETDKRSILVTAFGPFGGDGVNPTQLVLEALPDEIGGFEINKLLLPVVFGEAARLACEAIDRLSPAAAVLLGQAGGRGSITPEVSAKNLMDARIPDNAGQQPENEPIENGGAEKLYSTLPIMDVIARIRRLALPAELSYDAGAYVCNSLMYGVLSHTGGSIPAGFIHVPFIREQVEGVPGREKLRSMELGDIRRGVEAAIAAVADRIR